MVQQSAIRDADGNIVSTAGRPWRAKACSVENMTLAAIDVTPSDDSKAIHQNCVADFTERDIA